ncbi:MAG: hypothetical protein JHD16_17985, partial [Solirubrobacteraceae bacterium]|nr:hypothetical protein [Solirubrobacteraceae bacterium]
GNRLVLQGTEFRREPGIGLGGPSAAFTDPQYGWLVTSGRAGAALVRISPTRQRASRTTWPLPIRRPLMAITTEPGKVPGAGDASAIAVGIDGSVTRFRPGSGWASEALLDSNGVRQRTPRLRGVAWPEASRAHAVGADGEMWLWDGTTGLWERDQARPLDFDGNLVSVAFSPSDPFRGYAVGDAGVMLRYGKTWEQETLPPEIAGADLTSVAFAGNRAYAVFRAPDGLRSGVIYNDGGGWQVDQDVAALITDAPQAALLTVAGLPDGGVVVGGYSILLKRSGPNDRWTTSDTPPSDVSIVAAAPFRDETGLRAVISVFSRPYPANRDIAAPVPGESPQVLPAFPLPLYGTVLREGPDGSWRDDSGTDLPDAATGDEEPLFSDQVYALALDTTGKQGWAVGGAVVRADDGENAVEERERLQTAVAFRYPADTVTPSSGTAPVPVTTPRVRFAIGGHAACRKACADQANLDLAADVGLRTTIEAASTVATQPGGPRAFIYTGPRLENGLLTTREARRFALAATPPAGLPVFAATGADASGAGFAPFSSAFGAFPAPFGGGPQPPNVSTPADLPGVAPAPGQTRNHYTFSSVGLHGSVRVIVINNAPGSLAAADPDNVPADPSQREWLINALRSAKAAGLPAIVVGNRDLNVRGANKNHIATDAADIAQLLVDEGAS